MKKKTHIIVCALILGFLVSTMQADASEFALSQTKIVANIGETVDLDVTGTDKIPVWTSYNVNTARVNSDGEVAALRKGNTTISARVGVTRKTCAVTVVDSSIKLNKASATIYAGGTSTNYIQLKATIKGATKNVVWTSSNEAVAAVDKNGKVTSVSAGTAVITATANGKSASCIITVKASSISLNMDTIQLSTKGTGSSMKLTANIVGSKKNTQWVSSDKTIATVSGGRVTGKNTGTATITATANGVSASCTVNVIKDSISINEEKVLLYVGGTKVETNQLKTNAGKKDVVTWSSSNASVATVNEKGLVTAVGEGIAIISASCNGTTDTCEITVKQTATDILDDDITLKTKGTDKTYVLNKDIVGRSTSIKWKTSDSKVVTASNGKLTAKKAGTATITATANGVSDTVQVTVKDFDPTITLNQSEYALYTVKGNTVTLKATVDGDSKTVTWNSSNTAVATVNKGKVTAVGEGKTVISATANGVTAECIITVKETAVNLARTNITLSAGKTEIIPVDIVGASQTVKWTSTNTKIVTVKNGTITAKKNGEADVKVTANNVTSVCHVVVGDCEHDYVGKVIKEPSCSTVGEKTFTCTKCGDAYIETIATIPHSYDEVVTAPTCTEQGYTTHTCKYCGDSYADNYTDAKGHVFGEWTIEKSASDIENGIRARYCDVCNYKETESIPKGHTHVYDIRMVEATCTEDGYTLHICDCGDNYKTDIIPAMGHYMRDWVVEKAATTEEEGLEKRECSRCDYEETRIIPKHVHNFVLGEDWQQKEADCVNAGWKTYVCECGETKEEPIPALGHDYEATVVDPTCTEQGYTEHSCSRCGDTYQDTFVDALEHDEIEVIDSDATCTEYGWSHTECSRCHEQLTVSTKNISPLGHVLDEGVVTNPTCTEKGYTTYSCTRDGCNYSETGNETEALGHEKGSEIDKVYASKEGQGYTVYKCSRCDAEIKDDYTDYQPTEEQVYNDIMALQDDYPEGMEWTNDNFYGSKSGFGGYGCHAFALIMSDSAFGYLNFQTQHTNFDDLKVGDLVRLNNDTHTVVILEIKDSSVIVAEGNYNSSIHWGREISKDTINNTGTYVLTRYP